MQRLAWPTKPPEKFLCGVMLLCYTTIKGGRHADGRRVEGASEEGRRSYSERPRRLINGLAIVRPRRILHTHFYIILYKVSRGKESTNIKNRMFSESQKKTIHYYYFK